MGKGKVKIERNVEKYASCNCCRVIDGEPDELFNVEFILGSHSTLIRLCKGHLTQLKSEIDRQIN